jgi:predicted PurR-regulated permease PerM
MPERLDEQTEIAEHAIAQSETRTERAYRRRTDRIQTAAQVIMAIAVVLAICYIAKLVLVVLLVSVLLAFMLAPIVDGLQRLRVPRSIGSAVALLLLFAALWGISYVFYNRGVAFADELPKYTRNVRQKLEQLEEKAERIRGTTGPILNHPGPDWTSAITLGAGKVWDIALTVSFVPFLVYFMLTWQEHARAATVMLFRLENRNTAYVTLGRISAMIRSFLVSNLLMGIFMGAAGTVVFGILHLPYFYFVGFISGFVSLVPYLGPVVALIPPLAAGIGQLSGGGMLFVVIVVFGLHLFSINVLYPKLVGKRLQLNPLVVSMSLLVWGWVWGALGLILAVPVTAALKIIFDHVESLRPYGAWLGE